METLNDTKWDVIISGTGLTQSLLALALSRSGKKILHIDQNNTYGGPEAALSLKDAESWCENVNAGASNPFFPFEDAKIEQLEQAEASTVQSQLGSSRSYSLSLSPQLIYTQSRLIPLLVSSHVYQTLDFLAVGNWWVAQTQKADDSAVGPSTGIELKKIPSGREDVFADDTINVRSKRALMKFLRYVMQRGSEEDSEPTVVSASFAELLKDEYHIPESLHQPLLALALSPDSPVNTPAEFALGRINRHMKSIGVFGPGFGSLIVKWGGLSEIAQASCRALAVGGGVYVLGQKIDDVKPLEVENASNTVSSKMTISFTNGDKIETDWLLGAASDLPTSILPSTTRETDRSARAIYVISSPLEYLFSNTSDSGPPPAGTVVVFPGTAHSGDGQTSTGPTYLFVHSSDTGECPKGQCIIYASCGVPSSGTKEITNHIHSKLDASVEELLLSIDSTSPESTSATKVLWSMHYTSRGTSPLNPNASIDPTAETQSPPSGPRETRAVQNLGNSVDSRMIVFPVPSLDLSFDDSIIDTVKSAWEKIMGSEIGDATDFMQFENREGMVDE